MKVKYITSSDQETEALGQDLALSLRSGDLVCLYGNLGAGKTVFAKGLAKGFKIEEEITSPSYTIMKEYQINDRLFLAHFDFYRLEDSPSQPPADLTDYLGDNEYITVIEWPDRVKKYLPKKRIDINIKRLDDSRREIIIKS